MQDDESLRKDVEATLGELEGLAGQEDSKQTRSLLVRGFRRFIERLAIWKQERAEQDDES